MIRFITRTFLAISWFAAIGGASLLAAESTTPLGQLAASMKPGQWAELKTTGYTADLIRVPRQHIYQYTHDGQWDPKTEQFLFLGQGHDSDVKFIAYAASTNAWHEPPPPARWKIDPEKGRGPIGHAYDNNALDAARRVFYHQQSGSPNVHRYHVEGGEWIESLTLDERKFSRGGHSSALAVFGELGGLVRIHRTGHVDLLETKTGNWRAVSRDEQPMGSLHPFIESGPVHHVVIFGGGNGSNAVYRLDAKGTVTPLASPPSPGLDSTHRYVIIVDPAGGEFLVIDNTQQGRFYAFDVVQNQWRLISESIPAKGMMIAAPVSNHGVVILATYRPEQVWLYKHSESSPD